MEGQNAPGVSGRLHAAGHDLPAPPESLGLYLPARRAGDLVFTAGQLPIRDGSLLASGKVGDGVSLEAARDCAALAALRALAAASAVCDLDAVTEVVRLTGYVASAPSFTAQPAVVDGASGVMEAAFGEAGGHARVAVGVAVLPMDSPVEVEVVLRTGA